MIFNIIKVLLILLFGVAGFFSIIPYIGFQVFFILRYFFLYLFNPTFLMDGSNENQQSLGFRYYLGLFVTGFAISNLLNLIFKFYPYNFAFIHFICLVIFVGMYAYDTWIIFKIQSNHGGNNE